MRTSISSQLAFIIPAYNEAESIGPLLDELHSFYPDATVFVISDGSVDQTAKIAAQKGARVLDLACNLGLGGAVQTGLKQACALGFSRVVRLDGDGQHPPSEVHKLLKTMDETGVDCVVGSRFLGNGNFKGSTHFRHIGNILLSKFLTLICRNRITDPACGFWCIQGKLLEYFATYYPSEYPEPEAIALLHRQGYMMKDVAVTVIPRRNGKSTINSIDTLYFALRVFLAILADRVRPVDRRFAKPNNNLKRS